ncbi:MAG: ElaA protein [Actinomycetota bacterium]|nr:ElaA protein [Actinomycetota bacterium]
METFSTLSAEELYALLRLRGDVFVCEQDCAYQDLDGRDLAPGTQHVWFEDDAGPVAYLRVLEEATGLRLGRVCTRREARGHGLAAGLVAHTLDRHPGVPVVLAAQAHLVGFYSRFGFAPAGAEFVENDIRHIPMRRPPGSAATGSRQTTRS